MSISTTQIVIADKDAFLGMAEQHFRGLNSEFVPHEDWRKHYFENILSKPRTFARWITLDGERVGFIIFGLEDHRFLPRLTGAIYELYVRPEFRRMGIARACALQSIQELRSHAPSKIQLEVVEGNGAARALWKSLGFVRVAERMVL